MIEPPAASTMPMDVGDAEEATAVARFQEICSKIATLGLRNIFLMCHDEDR